MRSLQLRIWWDDLDLEGIVAVEICSGALHMLSVEGSDVSSFRERQQELIESTRMGLWNKSFRSHRQEEMS